MWESKLERIQKLSITNLPPKKKLQCYKAILFTTIATLIVLNICSLGITGPPHII